MNETNIYRKALELVKSRIDLYGSDINPTAEEIRYGYERIQQIINNALAAGDRVKKTYNKVITATPRKNK